MNAALQPAVDWTTSDTHQERGIEQADVLVWKARPSGALAANFPHDIPVALPPTFEQLVDLKRLEAAICRDLKDVLLDIDDCTSHHFSDGIYVRKWTQPAGSVVVSKTHRKENFLLLVAGEALLTTATGPVRAIAPHMVLTTPGVKRAVYAVTDLIIITIHPNPDNERDMEKLEARFIIPEVLGQIPQLNGERP